jgi:hypothetical protein
MGRNILKRLFIWKAGFGSSPRCETFLFAMCHKNFPWRGNSRVESAAEKDTDGGKLRCTWQKTCFPLICILFSVETAGDLHKEYKAGH